MDKVLEAYRNEQGYKIYRLEPNPIVNLLTERVGSEGIARYVFDALRVKWPQLNPSSRVIRHDRNHHQFKIPVPASDEKLIMGFEGYPGWRARLYRVFGELFQREAWIERGGRYREHLISAMGKSVIDIEPLIFTGPAFPDNVIKIRCGYGPTQDVLILGAVSNLTRGVDFDTLSSPVGGDSDLPPGSVGRD